MLIGGFDITTDNQTLSMVSSKSVRNLKIKEKQDLGSVSKKSAKSNVKSFLKEGTSPNFDEGQSHGRILEGGAILRITH